MLSFAYLDLVKKSDLNACSSEKWPKLVFERVLILLLEKHVYTLLNGKVMTTLQTQNTALKQVDLSLDLFKVISVYVLVDVFQTSFYK